jgi:hypothetical protein
MGIFLTEIVVDLSPARFVPAGAGVTDHVLYFL